MRKTAVLIVLAGLVFVAAAVGDTVYMRDGRKIVGKVTEKKGKYLVKMAYGTTTVDKSKVIYVAYGTGTTRPTTNPDPLPDECKSVDPNLSRTRRWNINEATLPEPIVFMLSRRLELLGRAGTDTMRRQLRQWKIAAHDGKRKLGRRWLTRAQQRQYRASFEKHLRQGDEFARQAERISPRTGSDRAKQRKLRSSAEQEYAAAVRTWPDALMRDFLTAVLDLRNRKYKKAQSGFARCIRAEPLTAAFRQGRGIALSKLKQPLEALVEFTYCLQLRDDTDETIRLIEAAMKDVPGAKLGDPVYLKAQDLLGRYEKPKRTTKNRNTGTTWLMPGAGWQKRSHRQPTRTRDDRSQPDTRFSLLLPPYDRIISKQALAIPVSKTALLVDKNAIAGAKILYVQAAPNLLVRAWTKRSNTRVGRRDRPDLPLAIIYTEGVTFTPVDLEKPAGLKAGQTVTIRAVNLYRRMGTKIRTGAASVKADATLSATLMPGETVGAVLAGDTFAGLLTARTRPQKNGCGISSFIKPADLAAWIKPIRRSLGGKNSTRRPGGGRAPKIKKDVPKQKATGNVFLVHILIGEKPPASEVVGNWLLCQSRNVRYFAKVKMSSCLIIRLIRNFRHG